MTVLFDDPVVTALAAPCAGSLQVGMEIVDPVFGGRARPLVHVEEYRDPDRLGWWVFHAQRAWRDLTRAQRTALLAVDSGLPAKHSVVSRLDDKGLTEGGAVTHLGRWVLRVCADRHLDATFELDSPAGAVVVGPVAS